MSVLSGLCIEKLASSIDAKDLVFTSSWSFFVWYFKIAVLILAAMTPR